MIHTTDRQGRHVLLVRFNSNPDRWASCYLDGPLWDGGWFVET